MRAERIAFALPDISKLEVDGVCECLNSGWLTSGAKTQEFERSFALRIGAKHAVSCNSATMGALLIMDALGIGPGDEVVVPTWTFSGPAMMAVHLGATVVLADVDSACQLTVDTLAAAVTPRTRLVMPTHFAGRSCDMGRLLAFCAERGLILVDDAAHAFPTVDMQGRTVGAQGARATFFSFYVTKTLTTGEGGMVVTEDDELAARIRTLRLHGISRDVFARYTDAAVGWAYDIEAAGWKANMTDMAAAIGLGQLARTETMLCHRRNVAVFYHSALHPLERLGFVVRPSMEDGHAWHLYPIRVLVGRDRFIALMGELGVQCSVHFIPLHHHTHWQKAAANAGADFAIADALFEQVVSLPIYSRMTHRDAERVVQATSLALSRC